MIAIVELKAECIKEMDIMVDEYREKYKELTEKNPSTTVKIFTNEDNLTVKVKILDLGTAVN